MLFGWFFRLKLSLFPTIMMAHIPVLIVSMVSMMFIMSISMDDPHTSVSWIARVSHVPIVAGVTIITRIAVMNVIAWIAVTGMSRMPTMAWVTLMSSVTTVKPSRVCQFNRPFTYVLSTICKEIAWA